VNKFYSPGQKNQCYLFCIIRKFVQCGKYFRSHAVPPYTSFTVLGLNTYWLVTYLGNTHRCYKNKTWLTVMFPVLTILKKQTPWSESASELYRPSDRRLSAKWLPTFAARGCHVVSVTGSLRPYSRFSRQDPLLFYQVSPQLYSRGRMDPVPDPLLFFW
jgi:hypothetical protein